MSSAGRRHAIRLLLSLLVAALFLWLLHRAALPVVPQPEDLARVEGWSVTYYLLLWCVVHALRALRWRWLLLPVCQLSYRVLLGVSFVGFAAIVALPLRTGELVRPLLLERRAKVSAFTATGAVAAERVVDGLLLSLLLLLALECSCPLERPGSEAPGMFVHPDSVQQVARAAALAFLAGLALLVVFHWRRDQVGRLVERTVGMASPRLARWASERMARTAEGLRFLRSPRHALPFLLVTCAYWLLNAWSCSVLARGCGFDQMSFWQASVLVGVLALGILAPNAPGFFGAYQLSAYAGLLLYFPVEQVKAQGSTFVFLIYIVQLSVTFGAGLAGLLFGQLHILDALALRMPDGNPTGRP